ncbi:MAG: N-acetylneuraminate synthase [Gemmatimonas sp.]|nr:N-acetylneuraminate synthase [Gemmatimonas sp.]
MSSLAIVREVKVGDRWVGQGLPVYVVAEIGINHNGDVEVARQLIDQAVEAGCDAVKFQKRTPELCVPADQRNLMRQTPWGYISYLDYRRRVELSRWDYEQLLAYCHARGIAWFASCWDEPSVDFIEYFHPPCYKVQSAAVTDLELLRRIARTGRPVVLSTGMSSMEQIRSAAELFDMTQLVIAHSTSTYPCPPEQLNLQMIDTLRREFPCPIGYSGHEVGISTTAAAVALGAGYVERHITLDRGMWGSDQAASLELSELKQLVSEIRSLETAMGDGIKQIYPSELLAMQRLRRVV